ncbi:HalOD1 output domain-containing protein [Natronorubrum sp. A-ect3]|uniref:HalOD1 output domain-containing protein n=1 Tax=Natronorubrum sp. A-ect3 TaxID=3242698 RepID=UPI00359DD7F4
MSTENDSIERQYGDGRSAVVAIIDGISTLEESDQTANLDEFSGLLYEYVDPEAINAIMGDGTGSGDIAVSFTVDAYQVSVADSGRVLVRTQETDR